LNADETLYGIVHGTKINSNDFVYCGNDPVNRVDSEGHFWEKVRQLVVKVCAAPLNAIVSPVLRLTNFALVKLGIPTDKLAKIFLDMDETRKNSGIYYAKFNCWQQYMGYNNLYDILFAIGTDMESERYIFKFASQTYCFWAWKGDYINLGAGAELGIYQYSCLGVWTVNKDLALNMNLRLYYLISRNGRKLIINRSDYTWWITGFNSHYLLADVKKLKAIITIDLKCYKKLFEAFKETYSSKENKNISYGYYTIKITI
jgi:hypothetical protein